MDNGYASGLLLHKEHGSRRRLPPSVLLRAISTSVQGSTARREGGQACAPG